MINKPSFCVGFDEGGAPEIIEIGARLRLLKSAARKHANKLSLQSVTTLAANSKALPCIESRLTGSVLT